MDYDFQSNSREMEAEHAKLAKVVEYTPEAFRAARRNRTPLLEEIEKAREIQFAEIQK